MSQTSDPTETSPPGDFAPAPHGLRLGAWLIDCFFLAIVFSTLPSSTSRFALICLFIVYHTTLLWLLQQTLGKALLGLKVARVGKPASLLWAFGRSSAGYFIVDLFGVGILIALFNRRRRALHDYVFSSVVFVDDAGPLTLKTLASRFLNFAERQMNEANARKRLIGIVAAFWAFHIGLAKSVIKVFEFLSRLGSASQSVTAAPSLAEMWSAKAIAGLAVATTATTTVVVTAVPGVDPALQWLREPPFSALSSGPERGEQYHYETITHEPRPFPVNVFCSERQNELCVTPFSVGIRKEGLLTIRYFVGGQHCAAIKVHVYADNVKVHTTETLKWSGAGGEFAKYALDSGVVVISSLPDGEHEMVLRAEGVPGGCAPQGILDSWGGQVDMWVSPAASPGSPWRLVSAGDCTGNDSATILPTQGEQPLPANCQTDRAGTVAVCWDGKDYVNPATQPGWKAWCTYKNVSPSQCRGGGSPGRMYVCP